MVSYKLNALHFSKLTLQKLLSGPEYLILQIWQMLSDPMRNTLYLSPLICLLLDRNSQSDDSAPLAKVIYTLQYLQSSANFIIIFYGVYIIDNSTGQKKINLWVKKTPHNNGLCLCLFISSDIWRSTSESVFNPCSANCI